MEASTKPKKRTEFVARRRQLGFSQKSLAERLEEVTEGTVRGWESGRHLPSVTIRPALAEALEVNMIELGRLLGIEPDLDIDEHKVQQWLGHYDLLIGGSRRTAKVDLLVISDLLQTRAYAYHLERTFPGATSSEVDRRVANRLRRQDLLYRDPNPLVLVAILSEAVLRSNIGGPDVMAEQLRHLSLMADRPNVEIRILPDDGRAACAVSTFEILTWPDDPDPVMVVTYDVTGAYYHEGTKRKPFLQMYDHLMRAALSPEESAARIHQIREDQQR